MSNDLQVLKARMKRLGLVDEGREFAERWPIPIPIGGGCDSCKPGCQPGCTTCQSGCSQGNQGG